MNRNILKWIIYGGLFLIPFVPFLVFSSFYFPFITSKAFVWRIIVELVLASWILLAVLEPKYRPKKSIVLYCFIAFTFIIGVADAFGVSPIKSFWSNFERMEGYITILHLLGLFFVMASMFAENEWKKWWNTSLVASFFMSLYCLLQLAGVLDIHQSGARVDGSLGNSAYLAVYMLFHIFFAWFLLEKEKKGSFMKWIYGSMIFLQTIILYYTATRGAILGLLGGLLVVALLNLKNKEQPGVKKISIIGIVLFFVLIGGFLGIKDTGFVKNSAVLSRFSNISISELKTEGRSFIWPMALKGVMEKPILGWGQENFNYVFDEHYNPAMYNIEPWFDRAHNIFLDWAISGGLLGLLAYLSLYVALLVSIWKKDKVFTFLDRTILTGLICAYFFHNLFVFDNLISYVLFVALLAYVHSRTVPQTLPEVKKVNTITFMYASPIVVICLIGVLYFVNIQPIMGNMSLINGLQSAGGSTAQKQQVLGYFTDAHDASRLGRPESVEWIVSSTQQLLNSDVSTENKNAYFAFAKTSIENLLIELPTDARYQILAGSFYTQTGFPDDALKHLDVAKALIPGKQAVYIELGSAYLNKGDVINSLKNFKMAYEMAPANTDAQIIYLIGGLYAHDSNVMNQMTALIPENTLVTDDRIAGALLNTKDYSDLILFLKKRIILKPTDIQSYASLAAAYIKLGDKTSAIQVLQNMETVIPASKDQAEQYIKGIQNGTIK
jgi:O-antigen ligase/tetratricopeptide (TPR) repeat protein